MTKQSGLTILKGLADEFQLEDLIYRLRVSEEIDEAEACVPEGRVVSHRDAKRIAESWKGNPNS